MKRRVNAACSALFGKAKALPRRAYEYGLSFYQRHDSSYLALCFFLPFLLMLVIYTFMGAWPFGDKTVMTLDLNGQYVYFFEALRDCVWGDKSLLYSFSRALGGEFLGIYAYYLASPLSYIVALFPKENMTEAIFFMLSSVVLMAFMDLFVRLAGDIPVMQKMFPAKSTSEKS